MKYLQVHDNKNQIYKLTEAIANMATDDTIQQLQTKVTALEGKTSTLKSNGTTSEFLNGTGQYSTPITIIPITELSMQQGTITLEVNKVYRATFNGAVTFTLPSVTNDDILNQILIQAHVTNTSTITWGTESAFGAKFTSLTNGRYNIIFEYNGNSWVYGVMEVI